MPKGKTHDKITFLLIAPIFLVSYVLTYQVETSFLATGAMVFGGLMFGPDLDINSRQYNRWGPLRVLWWPYQKLFSHRSPFTHGILLGTIVRIGYFLVTIGLVCFISIYLFQFLQGKEPKGGILLNDVGYQMVKIVQLVPLSYLKASLIGVWLGAASHTLADLVTTTFKQIVKSL